MHLLRFRSVSSRIGVAIVGALVALAALLIAMADTTRRWLADTMVEREIAAMVGAIDATLATEAAQALAVATAVAANP
ncbi:MAG: hypothetical protein NZM27_11015, partial [Acetobacteraceae bacterium]|nr:hypothetical protein [Acetobacteraceae bacterium]